MRTASPLLLVLALGGCSGADLALPIDVLRGQTEESRNVVSLDSLTVQRLRGGTPEVEPLAAEPGNVWPDPEPPRATLANPDEAMRNIPAYRPSLIDGAPPAAAPVMPPRRAPGSSSLPLEPLPLREPASPQVVQPAQAPTPPPPRADGRAVPLPDGRTGITTGGNERVQGLVTPGGGSGSVIRDGNRETVILPDGRTETRIVPR